MDLSLNEVYSRPLPGTKHLGAYPKPRRIWVDCMFAFLASPMQSTWSPYMSHDTRWWQYVRQHGAQMTSDHEPFLPFGRTRAGRRIFSSSRQAIRDRCPLIRVKFIDVMNYCAAVFRNRNRTLEIAQNMVGAKVLGLSLEILENLQTQR